MCLSANRPMAECSTHKKPTYHNVKFKLEFTVLTKSQGNFLFSLSLKEIPEIC